MICSLFFWYQAGVLAFAPMMALPALERRKIVYQSKINGNYMFCASYLGKNGDS
jgi:hypothetical protein